MRLIVFLASLLTMNSLVTAAASSNDQWGDLIDDIATLTWAEKNCSGRASDAARRLRLHLRKYLTADFEEASIRVLTDIRDAIEPGSATVGLKEAQKWYCVGLNRVYGAQGRLPGLWQDNEPWAGKSATSGTTQLSRYGEFPRVLANIDYLRGRCVGSPTLLASAFIRIFIVAGGEKQFKALVDLPLTEQRTAGDQRYCTELKQKYGIDTNEWPQLWQ